jgi:parallel beta-helix repeat protein
VVTFPTNSSVKTRLDGFTVRNGGNTSYGGGINCPSGCQGVVANNQIMNNMASNGAGIACVSASPTLINNLILRNTASGLGGGIYLSNSSAQVINNTVLENSAPGSSPNKGGGITCIGTPSASIYNNIIAFNTSGIYSSSSTPVLKCNCLYGNAEYQYSGVAVGAGDISSDPLFYDRVNDDYHLDLSSPCKDKGYDAPVKASWVDLDGEARIFGSHVDIGFDEFHDDLTALAPVMDPEGGTYNGTVSVQLISATPDAVIHYTTNGNVPSESILQRSRKAQRDCEIFWNIRSYAA